MVLVVVKLKLIELKLKLGRVESHGGALRLRFSWG